MKLCSLCLGTKEDKALSELAFSKNRSVEDITRRINSYDSLQEKAKEQQEKRLGNKTKGLKRYQQLLKRYEELLSYEMIEAILQGQNIEELAQSMIDDEQRQRLEELLRSAGGEPQGISQEDVKAMLEEYEEEGLIDIKDGGVKITSKGSKLLAKAALQKILENLAKRDMGPHTVEEMGYGTELSLHSRPYEIGDDYEFVDIQRTLLNALERKPDRITLEISDFEIYETFYQTKLCSGLLIDESGSMYSDHKINAAVETSLALSALIRREPKDSLKVFAFSSRIREIAPWEIINTMMSGGSTDIRAALRAFRQAVSSESGDKHAYLITDSEPNTEDGAYIGFNRAMAGVFEEAARYRQEGITLNIIMLDQSPHLREFASTLARKNLGRVLFATPLNLGGMVIEDYLSHSKGRMQRRF